MKSASALNYNDILNNAVFLDLLVNTYFNIQRQ